MTWQSASSCVHADHVLVVLGVSQLGVDLVPRDADGQRSGPARWCEEVTLQVALAIASVSGIDERPRASAKASPSPSRGVKHERRFRHPCARKGSAAPGPLQPVVTKADPDSDASCSGGAN